MSVQAVDVVVLTWNDGPLLDVAVRSALESEGVSVRVIVFDNGSEPPAQVTQDPRVNLERSDENLGVAAGRNAGSALGSAPVVCFLDSDARLEPHALGRLVEVLDEDRSIAMSVPVFVGQTPQASAGRAAGVTRKAMRSLGISSEYAPSRLSRLSEQVVEVEFGIGACQVVLRSRFEELGGFDESFFYGPEDVDFCLRLRSAGGRVVQVSDAPCHHPPRRRHRSLLRTGGLRHAFAVLRHFARHPRV